MTEDIVYVYNFEKHGGIKKTVQILMDKLNWERIIEGNLPIYVKLNLGGVKLETFHYANTDMDVLNAFLGVVTSKTKDVFLIESDLARGDKEGGLYGGGRAEDMFNLNKIDKIAEKFGVNLMNLSKQEQVYGLDPLLEDFGLPKCLVDSEKVFVTMPVIKTHALTAFTGALKNQWGCVPRWDRILLHKNLDQLLAITNKIFRPDLIIMGGKHGMEGRGPTSGEPIKFPVLLGSTKPASVDAVAMSLIGLKPGAARHVELADPEVLGQTSLKKIKVIGEFKGNMTKFEPARLDWAVGLMNYLSRYEIFTYKIIQNQKFFEVGKKIVNFLRKIGVVR